jgi:hypothetical protein
MKAGQTAVCVDSLGEPNLRMFSRYRIVRKDRKCGAMCLHVKNDKGFVGCYSRTRFRPAASQDEITKVASRMCSDHYAPRGEDKLLMSCGKMEREMWMSAAAWHLDHMPKAGGCL